MTLNWPADQPTLDGSTIILRQWRPEDAQQVFEACQDEMVQAFTSVPSPYLLSDAVAFVALGPQIWAQRAAANFAITDPDNAVIGAISLMNIDEQAGQGEIGYWVADWARGNRVARRAVELLGDWALNTLGLWRVVLRIERENVASIAAALAAGAQPTGITVDKEVRNRMRNFGIYELLRSE